MNARFNLSVAEADYRLVQGAIDVMKAYRKGRIDPITGHKVSQRTNNIAKAVIAFYKRQVYYKYHQKYGIVPPFQY